MLNMVTAGHINYQNVQNWDVRMLYLFSYIDSLFSPQAIYLLEYATNGGGQTIDIFTALFLSRKPFYYVHGCLISLYQCLMFSFNQKLVLGAFHWHFFLFKKLVRGRMKQQNLCWSIEPYFFIRSLVSLLHSMYGNTHYIILLGHT